jgi:hypothetical protein
VTIDTEQVSSAMSRWIENDAQWYEQRMLHCGCCGRLIAKHLLVADADGEQKIFCSEACEQLYRDYALPERGPDYRPPTHVRELYEERMVK